MHLRHCIRKLIEQPVYAVLADPAVLFHSALPPRVSARMAFYKTIKVGMQELWFFLPIL